MRNNAKVFNAIALLVAFAAVPLSAHSAIVIGPPTVLSADKFQLKVSLDEAFPTVDALQVDINFAAAGLSLDSVDISPASPFATHNTPQKQFARPDRVSFLFVNDQADVQAGPLLLLTFHHSTPLQRPAPVEAKLRFQWVDLIRDPVSHEVIDFGDEFDVARSATIDAALVPEPSGVILLAVGIALVGLMRSRAHA